MSIKTLNQYKASYEDGAVDLCNAEDFVGAVTVLSAETEPIVVQKIGKGIKVAIPDPALAFETVVGAESFAAGCRAYPSGGAVEKEQKVFLSAVPAEGYNFVGWYQGETLLSEDAEAEVTVASTSQVPVTIKYEAKFTLA